MENLNAQKKHKMYNVQKYKKNIQSELLTIKPKWMK